MLKYIKIDPFMSESLEILTPNIGFTSRPLYLKKKKKKLTNTSAPPKLIKHR